MSSSPTPALSSYMTYATPPVVGLIGKKRSGKDTFAWTLREEFDYAKVAFADKLRTVAEGTDPLVGRFVLPGADGPRQPPEDGWHLHEVLEAIGYERAKEIPEVRRFYQRLGTNGVRSVEDDFWLRHGLESIAIEHTLGHPVVVTDVRFPNEADAIRERGGVIVRIVRPGLVSTDQHPSETALDNYGEDFVVINDHSLEQLANIARWFAIQL